MFKNLVWNIIQFVANPGLASIVLYRVILQLNSVVRPDSTERNYPNQSTLLHFVTPFLFEFQIYNVMLYFLPTYYFYSVLLNLRFGPDIQFFSGSLSRSSSKTKTKITLDFFFGGIRSFMVYLTLILNIVEASRLGRGFIC
ncbi:Hypothetical_protein [Hexamita inflata]|uniref:Hypothetical_protein n=1 Tax=Hexamita inflata TaxID=28002 RepID=A0AA86U2V2_9EUKA|nr:Hypothetical protein HINF_LOCUS26024 [Hexamita inflata]